MSFKNLQYSLNIGFNHNLPLTWYFTKLLKESILFLGASILAHGVRFYVLAIIVTKILGDIDIFRYTTLITGFDYDWYM